MKVEYKIKQTEFRHTSESAIVFKTQNFNCYVCNSLYMMVLIIRGDFSISRLSVALRIHGINFHNAMTLTNAHTL